MHGNHEKLLLSTMTASDSRDDEAPVLGSSEELDGQSEATSPASHERSRVIDHAIKFLDDSCVKGAKTEDKIHFLQQKGLEKDEIDKLLHIKSDPEAKYDVCLCDFSR